MSDTSVMQQQREKSAAELRKMNKPLVEKRRRGRINNCLETLKTLILDATKKDTIRYSKLEKADVLEMTVKHLRDLSRGSGEPQAAATINKYRAGFNECATEVTRFLAKEESLSPEMRMSLLNHLAGRLQHVNALVNSANPMPPQPAPQPLYHPYVPSATPLSSLPGANLNLAGPTMHNPTLPVTPQGPVLVPAQLPGGQMAYLLSTSMASKSIPNEPPKFASTPIYPERREYSTKSAGSSVLSSTPSSSRRRYSATSSARSFGMDYSTSSAAQTMTSSSCSTSFLEPMQISVKSEDDSYSSASVSAPYKPELLSPQESELDVTSGSDILSPPVPTSPSPLPLDINGNAQQVANRNISQMSVDSSSCNISHNTSSFNASSSFNSSNNSTNNANSTGTSSSCNATRSPQNLNRNINVVQDNQQAVNINQNDNADDEDMWRPW